MANKFTGINAAKRLEKAEAEPIIEKAKEMPLNGTHAPKTVGRPKGKKSGGEYQQVTVYIKKDLLLEIKDLLMTREKINLNEVEKPFRKQDFSDFVNDALIWYRNEEHGKIQIFLHERYAEEQENRREQKKLERQKAKENKR